MSFSLSSKQHFADEVVNGRIGRCALRFRPIYGFSDVFEVAGRDLVSLDIGAIDGEAGDGFCECVPQAFDGEVASVTIRERDPTQMVCQHIQLTVQRAIHHQLLALVNESLEIESLSDK